MFIVLVILHVVSFFFNITLYDKMVHVYLYLNNELNFIDETLHCVQTCVWCFVQTMTLIELVEIRV